MSDIHIHVLKSETLQIKNWLWDKVQAPFWRFYWNDKAGWKIHSAGKTVELDPGFIFAVSPDTQFRAEGTALLSHFFIEFTAGMPYDGIHDRIYRFPIQPLLKQSILEIQNDTCEERKPALISFLCHYLIAQVPADDLAPHCRDPRIADILYHLNEHLDQRISNDQLARQCNMNTNAFIRLFKTATGQTPQAWHLKRRIDTACALLHQSDDSIEIVSEKTGFADRGHFSRAFRSHRGIGPAAFRKVHDTSVFLTS